MNKKYFENLAKYNCWANQIVYIWLNQITDIQWNTKLVGSMESIAATAIHTAGAEKIWLERLIGLYYPFLTKRASENLLNYVSNLPEEEFIENFTYNNFANQRFNSNRFEALAHVFNHSTYHRGQIVNYLRQVGFDDVGSTDLINYYRLGI